MNERTTKATKATAKRKRDVVEPEILEAAIMSCLKKRGETVEAAVGRTLEEIEGRLHRILWLVYHNSHGRLLSLPHTEGGHMALLEPDKEMIERLADVSALSAGLLGTFRSALYATEVASV
jgi:hypothetical protein